MKTKIAIAVALLILVIATSLVLLSIILNKDDAPGTVPSDAETIVWETTENPTAEATETADEETIYYYLGADGDVTYDWARVGADTVLYATAAGGERKELAAFAADITENGDEAFIDYNDIVWVCQVLTFVISQKFVEGFFSNLV